MSTSVHQTPWLFSRLGVTPVFDVYWQFAVKRQDIFFNRLSGNTQPWTDDLILQKYKFTNAYRASDRVSQFLIRDIIYNPAYPTAASEVVFRILLFKLFNRISTWSLLEEEAGPLYWQNFDFDRYDRTLTKAAASGRRIYSAAYIMPPVSLTDTRIKHHGHLRLLELIMKGDFVSKILQTSSLQEVFETLKSYPSLGDFLAFQLAIDLNYSDIIDHNESEFVVAGPGARDGLAKTFTRAGEWEPIDLIKLMMNQQESEFERLGLSFPSLWGRRLQLVDCQNLFCEISKYARISHPEIKGLFGRTRIKQLFKPQPTVVVPWYPPKWGLNGKIDTFETTGPQGDLFG
ncbi:MAG TPA: nucleotide kinase domain-containing protein [Stellaceae bacterium]|nr:nucleotide kinase domain-containing protein [Stellaceae bacterium]